MGTAGLAPGVGAEPVLILCREEKSTHASKPRPLLSTVCRLESFLTYEANEQHTTRSSLQVRDSRAAIEMPNASAGHKPREADAVHKVRS